MPKTPRKTIIKNSKSESPFTLSICEAMLNHVDVTPIVFGPLKYT